MHRSKQNVGSISYGGSAGTNVIATVDGGFIPGIGYPHQAQLGVRFLF